MEFKRIIRHFVKHGTICATQPRLLTFSLKKEGRLINGYENIPPAGFWVLGRPVCCMNGHCYCPCKGSYTVIATPEDP
ncbi:hypothetical protein C0J52_28235 [Blattella germanica]|nr:hypothetical protein C0J52_28235 [Blattella germanica]